MGKGRGEENSFFCDKGEKKVRKKVKGKEDETPFHVIFLLKGRKEVKKGGREDQGGGK